MKERGVKNRSKEKKRGEVRKKQLHQFWGRKTKNKGEEPREPDCCRIVHLN